MNDSNEKGSALERATRAIEEMVIRSQPGLAQAPFSIEPNARIPCSGVLLEFDLLVRINQGSPYETHHVFECKNWRDPVDRNAVTIFGDKMEALGAARGTLIGRSFTKDAEIQAKKFKNLELVSFNEDLWGPIRAMQFDVTSHHFTRFQVHVTRRAGTPEAPEPDWLTVVCRFGPRTLSFMDLVHQLANEWLAQTGVMKKDTGVHKGSGQPAWEMDPGELVAGAWDVVLVHIDFDYVVKIRPARLVSTFSIDRRGRFARFECDKDDEDKDDIAVEVLGRP